MVAFPAEHEQLDDVFRALADPGRRRLLDSLNSRNGQTLRELCGDMAMARQSVSKHLAVLEAANLVTTVWRGREKLHYLNPAPINDISERWINRYERHWVDALADLKRALESPPMDRPSFVYTTYIQTTPERLWEALTNPAFTERYWNAAFDTDWEPGSPMVWTLQGVRIADPAQVVLEAEPYRRLSFRAGPRHRRQRGGVRRRGQRAAVQGDLRTRAGRQRREADRHPRRPGSGRQGGRDGEPRLAAGAVEAQDPGRDR